MKTPTTRRLIVKESEPRSELQWIAVMRYADSGAARRPLTTTITDLAACAGFAALRQAAKGDADRAQADLFHDGPEGR